MRNRLWNIVAVGIMVAILAGGWFLGVDPQLSAARASNEQSAAVEAQNDLTSATADQLARAEEDLPALQDELATLQRSIPATAQTSAFIDDLNVLANAAGVTVSAIAVSDAQPYVAPVAADVPAAATAETPAEGETAEAAPDVDPLAPPAVTSPLVGSDNFVLVPISVEVKGSAQAVLDFVSGLQSGKRLFLVTSYSSSLGTEEEGAGIVTATTTGYIYALLGQYSE
ncbi:hypothetical protein GCM10027413_31840 [Conyzicola nivalis]|uniref:Uncharacterized protein n=1 Tax=Conyzicola nivalis TaxID=1477021 RepID=A0A916WMB5_9MICO|nr:hypothetical protein [Conyzicola nivalis]GGB11817.1 hypothetical protein GCM10010979_27680 [Conyzicola nivalis]